MKPYKRCDACSLVRRVPEAQEVCGVRRRAGGNCEGRLALDGRCQAVLFHGPGHQSSTRCCVEGPHEVHEAVYGSDRTFAEWRDGAYTSKLREKGIEFNSDSYPENMAMTGFFDEPPEDPDE